VLLVQSGSKLAVRSDQITASQLRSIAPMVPAACLLAGSLSEQLHDLAVESHSSVTPESVATAQALVSAGLGAAIVPSRLLDWTDARTVAVDLSHLLVPHTVVLALNEERSHSAAVYGFVHALREICDADPGGEHQSGQTDEAADVTTSVGSRAA
jgi:DNA-binding transcriptional LysR family regulator